MNLIFFIIRARKTLNPGESKIFYSQGTTISCLSKKKFYFGKNELNRNVMISAESEIDEMTTVWKEKKSLNPQN